MIDTHGTPRPAPPRGLYRRLARQVQLGDKLLRRVARGRGYRGIRAPGQQVRGRG
jgi:hypothetical protein